MVRPNELSFARRGALNKLAARRQGARPSQLTAVLVGVDPEDDSRAIVSFDGAEVSVLAGPVKMIPGALCAVEVDSANAPVRVLGPVTTRPEGLDEDVPAPDAVMPMPELGPRELTEAEAQAIQDTADGLAEAQGRVSAAEGLLDAIGASDGPDGVADAISDYLAIPLDQITIVDNRGPSGEVFANLYDAIIVDGLLTASGVITEDLIATGAIESRHLNVVPEEGTGGVEILPPGIRIIPPDAEAGTAISFRSDEDSWIAFAQGGESTFSVSPAGDLTAQTVAANDSFAYRGIELADLLARAPQGLVSANRVRLQNNFHIDNTERPLFTLDVPARDPAGGVRAMSIIIQLATYVSSANFELSVYSTYDGSTPTLSSTRIFRETMNTITGLTHVDVPIAGMAEYNWRFLVTVRLTTTDASQRMRITANNSTVAYVIDHGRAAGWDYQTLTGASATGTVTAPVDAPATPKTEQTQEFPASWVRTFTGSGAQYPRASNTKAYTGQYLAQNGVLGSMVGFSRTDVAAFTAGAEITNIEVFFKNVHSYSSAGMDAFWGVHGLSTAPSTQNVIAGSYSARFNKGQGRWLSVPENHWNAFKSGAATGFTLKPSSTSRSYYGIFHGEQTRLRITVRK